MSQSIRDNTMTPQESRLEALRLHDPFAYFSIPGVLDLEFCDDKEKLNAFLLSSSQRTVVRKTRVSTECSSYEVFADILEEVEAMEKEDEDPCTPADGGSRPCSLSSASMSDGIEDNDMECSARALEELRESDPFYYYSIPGALKLEFSDDNDSADAFLLSARKRNSERKTRVSCECSSLETFADIFDEDDEMEALECSVLDVFSDVLDSDEEMEEERLKTKTAAKHIRQKVEIREHTTHARDLTDQNDSTPIIRRNGKEVPSARGRYPPAA